MLLVRCQIQVLGLRIGLGNNFGQHVLKQLVPLPETMSPSPKNDSHSIPWWRSTLMLVMVVLQLAVVVLQLPLLRL